MPFNYNYIFPILGAHTATVVNRISVHYKTIKIADVESQDPGTSTN